MFEDLEHELEKNTDVLEESFRKLNLKVVQFSFQSIEENGDENADCVLILELIAIDGKTIKSNGVTIKVNLYDENGKIFLTERNMIFSHTFDGYDTIEFYLEDNQMTLLKAKSARIFATKV